MQIFFVSNRAVFYLLQETCTRKRLAQESMTLAQLSGTRFWYQILEHVSPIIKKTTAFCSLPRLIVKSAVINDKGISAFASVIFLIFSIV